MIEENTLICPVCGADAACEIQEERLAKAKENKIKGTADFFTQSDFLALSIVITIVASINVLVALVNLMWLSFDILSILNAVFSAISCVACWALYSKTGREENFPVADKVLSVSIIYKYLNIIQKIIFVLVCIAALVMCIFAVMLVANGDKIVSLFEKAVEQLEDANADVYGLNEMIQYIKSVPYALLGITIIVSSVVALAMVYLTMRTYSKMKEYIAMVECTVRTNEYDPKLKLPFAFCVTIGTIVAVYAILQMIYIGISGVSTLLEGAFIIVSAITFRAFHEKQFILETAVAAETDKLLTLQRQSTEMRANMKNRANRYEHEPDRHTGNNADAPNAPGNQDAPSGTGNPEA